MASSLPAQRSAAKSKSASKCAACRAIIFFACAACKFTANPSTRPVWGQRVAMNLTGPERASIERGQVICHEKLSLTSDRFDAFLEVRPAAAKGIKNHQRVRIHLGTAERLGKIVVLGNAEKLEPKQSAYCQVTLNEPLLVLRGDHFIVRDETARRTLAGGLVINPWAKRHKRE